MSYEFFYQGAAYSLEPGGDNLYTGAVLPQGSLGATTSIQTANQINEISNLLNSGMKVTELSMTNPDVFDMIPQQQLKEINRLTKLTGSDMTFHAPVIEPSGFTQQGWTEANREAAERQLADIANRAHQISPDKPMPMTIHASMIPGSETMPADLIPNLTEKEKEMYGDHIPTNLVVVNQDTGQPRYLPREIAYGPEIPEGEVWTPERRMNSLNGTQWSQQISQLALYKKEADDILRRARETQAHINQIENAMKSEELPPEQKQRMQDNMNSMKSEFAIETNKANMFLSDLHASFRNIYEQAAKYPNPKDKNNKKILNDISKQWINFEKSEDKRDAFKFSELLDVSLVNMQGIAPPQLYTPIENFAKKKASETFANVAYKTYKKHGAKAPIISIENPPYGQAISTAKDLKGLIDQSRQKFVKKAVSKGMTESAAKKAASDMIGATWDTSHISMIRKQGYGKKELIKQAEKIAPVVKHVHLNDNFGYTHTDLPPGMGDVPFKEIMSKLKAKGYKGKNIFEGGNFFQHFKTSPHPMVMQAMGSPLYSIQSQPAWTQVYGTMGTYSAGYGPFLPPQHFSTYGAGFSGLPQELGGQVQGGQSRLAGTPNN